ncbi:GNAT family N-acetyltransferase [Rothia halotolerans]|uniref:GNAT family N-acetyltransferase n=1 Tax=Rothia halotolerans TaxID=405770 RepID=UPI00101DEE94|nr:GNAT family N-acetyltransferase [Rothia halotolerans]
MAETTYGTRPAEEKDRAFLREMFVLTETWREPGADLPENFPADMERYVDRWSPEEGGVVLEETVPEDAGAAGRPVGAAWLRRLTDDDPGYGYVADEYPEVAIAVVTGHEGRGLGSRLLTALLAEARHLGYPGVSLSVEVGNDRAHRAYEKAGFTDLGPDDLGGHTMLHRFDVEGAVAD